MSIHYHDLEAATANAVTYARTQIDTTDVDTSSLSTHVFTADADVKDANWTTYCDKDWYNQGGTVSGMAVCNDLRGRECETSQVSIDRSFVADFALAHERKTVLHELLHTIGLKHRHPDYFADPPSVVDDVMFAGNNGTTVIGLHNREHIRAYY